MMTVVARMLGSTRDTRSQEWMCHALRPQEGAFDLIFNKQLKRQKVRKLNKTRVQKLQEGGSGCGRRVEERGRKRRREKGEKAGRERGEEDQEGDAAEAEGRVDKVGVVVHRRVGVEGVIEHKGRGGKRGREGSRGGGRRRGARCSRGSNTTNINNIKESSTSTGSTRRTSDDGWGTSKSCFTARRRGGGGAPSGGSCRRHYRRRRR